MKMCKYIYLRFVFDLSERIAKYFQGGDSPSDQQSNLTNMNSITFFVIYSPLQEDGDNKS